jgi:4-amino-4-deoxy-L-arabinose transferase-like glycosyltransferase
VNASPPEPASDDAWVAGAVGVAGFVRAAPLAAWGLGRCVRDECSYVGLARDLVAGEGMRAQDGWLWAPGYPYLLSIFYWLTGNAFFVKYLQVGLATVLTLLILSLGERVGGRKVGLIAAWTYALHPTIAYFAGTLWSESVYAFLLVTAVLALDWARQGSWRRALVPGALVGVCVLFRGVAQYMAPIFALAAVWPVEQSLRDALATRWRHALAVGLAAALVVAPWSIHASRTHGGFILSDATLGQMMWLGDNEFPPLSFDYGNGVVHLSVMHAWADSGRPHCDRTLPAAAWNACESAGAKAWIAENPGEFLARVPLRLAQLFQPHGFLVRHLRSDFWPAMPFWLKESLAWGAIGSTLLVWILGTLGAAARARGPFGVLTVAIVGYHVAAVALVAGLSRYRVPLEHLWLVYAAAFVAEPRACWAALRASPPRALAAALVLLILIPSMLTFLPHGFPGWP